MRRRHFLLTSALTLSAASYAALARQPNERVRLAVMGARIRGKFHLSAFPSQPDVEITHIIEPDESLLPAALDVLAKKQQAVPKTLADVRQALDDKTLDGLIVAAPDHWHALATIWACQAGKHVYVEKPCSHNLIEGRRMIEAARRFKRVVQVGTQRRSSENVQAAKEFVQAGKLGKVPFARTWIAGHRPSIGKKTNAPVPKGVDYSLWLGPAAQRDFNPNHFHYNWHWFWEYGTGELGNNGIHALDVVRNVLHLDAPTRISSTGGKFFYDDDQETPDTQVATFDFPGCTVTWEHRIWAKNGNEGEPFGIALHGEHGTLLFTRQGWEIRDGEPLSVPSKPGMEAAHIRDFLDCIKSGKRPRADIEEGHKSTRLCHLGNIAFRTGQTLHFDAATETTTSPEANKLLGRQYRRGFELPQIA